MDILRQNIRRTKKMAEKYLEYEGSSSLSPLQTSRDGVIKITVKQPTSDIYTKNIYISFHVGEDADCLFLKNPLPVLAWWCQSPGAWQFTKIGQEKAEKLGISFDTKTIAYEGTNNTEASALIDYPITIFLSGKVSSSVGEVIVSVSDYSSINGTDYDYSLATEISLKKSTAEFYLDNFMVTAASNPTVPRTEYCNGTEIRLSWESNGAYFYLYSGNSDKPIYEGEHTYYPVDANDPLTLTKDTFFFLRADYAKLGGDAVNGFINITKYDKIGVTVSDPDINANKLQVNGMTYFYDTAHFHASTQFENEARFYKPAIFDNSVEFYDGTIFSGTADFRKSNFLLLNSPKDICWRRRLKGMDSAAQLIINCDATCIVTFLADTVREGAQPYAEISDTRSGMLGITLAVTNDCFCQSCSLPVYKGCQLYIAAWNVAFANDWYLDVTIYPHGNCKDPVTILSLGSNAQNSEPKFKKE
jgi:hypothetical protein